MKTIMLVGLSSRDDVAERLFQAGLFVLRAGDVGAALAMLNAVSANAFVIDVRDTAVGGEKLIERLRQSPAWRRLPIVVTGASPELCERLAQRSFVGAIIAARELSADAILAALRPLLQSEASPIDATRGGLGNGSRYAKQSRG